MLRSIPLSSGVTGGKFAGLSVPAGGTIGGVDSVPGVTGVLDVDGAVVPGKLGVGNVSGKTGPLPEDGAVTPGVTAGVKPLDGTGFSGIEGGLVCIPGPVLERLDFIFAAAGLVIAGGFDAIAAEHKFQDKAHAKRLIVLAIFAKLPESFVVSRKMNMNHGPSGKPRINGV